MDRMLSLAAGMLVDVDDPVRCIQVAAEAGFDAVGLRFIDEAPTAMVLEAIRKALAVTGLQLLDLELVRLTDDRARDPASLTVGIAQELAPQHLTVVADHGDHGRLVDQLGSLCDAVNPFGVKPALEFLPFTGVRTFDQARKVVESVGSRRAAVLVDALHVTRSGDDPAVIAGVAGELVPYVQFCDAPARAPDDSDRGRYREAVAGRLLPGHGGLPLIELLRVLPPGTPLSVEVLSEELMTTLVPLQRAVACREATEAVLAATSATG